VRGNVGGSVTPGEQHFQWTAPQGWYSLPPGSDTSAWLLNVLADGARPASFLPRLRADLERFLAMRPPGTDRVYVAALDPDPTIADRVIAAGWLELGPLIDVNDAAERLREAKLPARLLARDVDVRASKRSPAVTCRDLLTGSSPEESTYAKLYERCAALVVHGRLGVTLRVELSTSDMAAFEDIAATCLGLADSMEVV
jgi:hypothetical protein